MPAAERQSRGRRLQDARHTALGIAAAGGHANIAGGPESLEFHSLRHSKVEILLAHGADATIVSLQAKGMIHAVRCIRSRL